MLLKLTPFLFLIPGFIAVFLAKKIVLKYGLDQKQTAQYESEMTEDEITQYKINKAVINLKMLGLVIALPGVVLLLLFFK